MPPYAHASPIAIASERGVVRRSARRRSIPDSGDAPHAVMVPKATTWKVIRAATVAKAASMLRAANTMWRPKRSPNTPKLSPSARHTNARARRGMSRHQPSTERGVFSVSRATSPFTQATQKRPESSAPEPNEPFSPRRRTRPDGNTPFLVLARRRSSRLTMAMEERCPTPRAMAERFPWWSPSR